MGDKVTNPMPGNPYAGPSPKGDAQTQATLALAHEKRTENLIALAALCTANGRKELGQPFIDLVMERIGIDGDDR